MNQRLQKHVRSSVHAVLWRENLTVWLASLTLPLAIAATALAIWRLGFGFRPHLFGPVVFIAACGVGTFGARRRWMSRQAAFIRVDVGCHAGGLLLASQERGLGAWETKLLERVQRFEPPPLRLTRDLLRLTGVTLFVVAVLWVPLQPRRSPRVDVAAQDALQTLEKKAKALEAEKPLEDAVVKGLADLRDALEHGGFEPVDWQAVDALSLALDQHAQDASKALAQAAETATSLAEALQKNASAEEVARQREALESALMQSDPGQGEQARAKAQSVARHGAGKQAEALAEAMRGRQAGLSRAFGEQKAEQGGPSRGPGAAPLTFTERVGFDHQLLPSSQLRGEVGDEPGELLGLKAREPTLERRGSMGPSSRALQDSQEGAAASNGRLLPKNRSLVERYFSTQRTPKK